MNKIVLAVHGGAGTIDRAILGPEGERAYCDALALALRTGYAVLAEGGRALDAVEAAVRVLEDHPYFNAGRGSVFNARGDIELEASLMDGRTLDAGAVAGLRRVRNPIVLARRVMERSPCVFLAGRSAMAFAAAEGVEIVDERWFWTDHRRKALEAARRVPHAAPPADFGTVGAVARDTDGNLAAATSTGGLTNKWPGRVGDSPIIGAGCFADNASCAVSCTGQGEFFIRGTIARDTAALIEYGGHDTQSAADLAIGRRLARLGGEGGVIVVDGAGRVVFAFNTAVMLRGRIEHGSAPAVAVTRDERC